MQINARQWANTLTLAVALTPGSWAIAQTSLPFTYANSNAAGLGPITVAATGGDYALSFSNGVSGSGVPERVGGAIGAFNDLGVIFAPVAIDDDKRSEIVEQKIITQPAGSPNTLRWRGSIAITGFTTSKVSITPANERIATVTTPVGWTMLNPTIPDPGNPDALGENRLSLQNIRVDYGTKSVIADVTRLNQPTGDVASQQTTQYTGVRLWQADTITGVEQLSNADIGLMLVQGVESTPGGLLRESRTETIQSLPTGNFISVYNPYYGTQTYPEYKDTVTSITAQFTAQTRFDGLRLTDEGLKFFEEAYQDAYLVRGGEGSVLDKIKQVNDTQDGWGSLTSNIHLTATVAVPEPNQGLAFVLGLLAIGAACQTSRRVRQSGTPTQS